VSKKDSAPLWLLILILIVGLVSFYFAFRYSYQSNTPQYHDVTPKPKISPLVSSKISPLVSSTASPIFPKPSPSVKIKPTPSQPLALLPPPSVTPPEEVKGVAIIIDDFGNDLEVDREFLKLPFVFTASILPQLKNSQVIAQEAKAAGKGVILHLPMQPISRLNPGPGAIKAEMDEEAITKTIYSDLATVPEAEGVNNHEGSLITQDKILMEKILKILKAKDLFFVDSLTSSHSIAGALAGELGLKWNQRSLFLDNKADEAYISEQIRKLLELANKQGSAIGICHTRRATLKALQALAPELQKSSIPLVPVKDLVR
jgi:polysaccharide deacetylase 2 family uncharacterized protein YibQ